MRSRRSILVVGVAVLLVLVSGLLARSARPIAPPAGSSNGWLVTAYSHGRIVGQQSCQAFPARPADLFGLKPHHEPVSYLIEPLSIDGATRSWLFPSGVNAENRFLVEFLLLLPPATLIVCLLRNLVGLNSFGSFAPALLGLAFREVQSPLGLFVILTIISAGWWLRRVVSELHLLQVPRTAVLLSCIVLVLLGMLAMFQGPGPKSITLFPLVILTGMIERYWSMEEEDGTAHSLRVLASTLAIAACVWLATFSPAVPGWLLRHPEALGYVLAGQILIGRYTGYRLLELYRFRSMLAVELPIQPAASIPKFAWRSRTARGGMLNETNAASLPE